MHVAEQQHVADPFWFVAVEAQGHRALAWIAPRSEQHVPQRQPVVLPMVAKLVVHRVHLGPLHDIAQPCRRTQVAVQEEVEQAGQQQCNRGGQWARAQHQVADTGIDADRCSRIERMRIERRQCLDPPRAVMQLVENPP
jgi:hypothetical protein